MTSSVDLNCFEVLISDYDPDLYIFNIRGGVGA